MPELRVAVVGAGAVGGYIGGKLAAAGQNVLLIDSWVAHIEKIRRDGLRITEPGGSVTVRVDALHLSDVQSLIRKPLDLALICTKSYDTAWAAMMIRPYLSATGCVVSVQNSLNEEDIAAAVGWERTLGCIASTISVVLPQAGEVSRVRTPGGAFYTVFRVGEAHGRVTPRAARIVELLSAVDSARVTTNLWGERWTKLSANTITHGLLGATGLDNTHVYVGRGKIHRLGVKLGGEAVAVGRAHGYEIGTILGISADDWYDAGIRDDAAALQRVQDGLTAWMATLLEPSHSSVGRDVMRGRRSEIDFTNGLVADQGAEAGVPAPTHAAVTELVRRIDRGELKPDPANVEHLPA